jgi:hypothetical protein
LQQLDALLNGLAFMALVVGLAIGWNRSVALRETLTELFLPSRQRLKSSRPKVKPPSLENNGVDQIETTWLAYLEQVKHVPSAASPADEAKTLSRLGELSRA